MGISLRIKELMKKKGVSAYNISKETGISQATLSRILNKNTKPNMNNLKILSKYFNSSEEWLLTGEGSMLKESVVNNNIVSDGNNNVNVNQGEVKLGTSNGDMSKLIDIIAEKDKQISKLIEHLTEKDKQISKLIEQQSKLIDKRIIKYKS